jgi:hypothetical protein
MSDVGKGPMPPPPAGRDGRRGGGSQADGRGKKKKQPSKHPQTEAHAQEVREVARGRDIVDGPKAQEKRPPAFDRKELLVVRSWLDRRPLEPTPQATALVQYPRLWATKRGRYCRFKAPGAGVYGLLRARPTF